MNQPAQLRPVVVFADDWGRHPSSAQHLVRHLLFTRSVVWVNTIGTRPPRLDWSTAKRAAGKLAGWVRPAPPPPAAPEHASGPCIVAPKMWPSFQSRLARRLNHRLLSRALRPVFASLPTSPTVLTTLPLVADLVADFPGARWVYYCVDNFAVWPGYDGATMARMERDLVPQMHAWIAVSETLVNHLGELGAPAELLTHGVDVEFWQAPRPSEPPPELAGIRGPIALFWGVVDRRLDVSFVRHLAETSSAQVVLIGPREDPDPELDTIPNVTLRPAAAFERLPMLAAAADVLVMPYADAPVTRAMQPLKMKEYLATGKPVVVRTLPATQAWHDALDVAATAAEFSAAVRKRLVGGVSVEQIEARRRLSAEGWAAKAERLAKILDAS